ncbi:MAG TPA: VWA domain-containing protein [Terriglobia bacterium]|nr:VWA domain-containing protein [Terriglobia bacterium]
MSGRSSFGHRRARFGVVVLAVAWVGTAGVVRSSSAQSGGTGEVTSHETQPTFQLHVQHNEVLVRIVVRDSKGRAVANLQKDDFRIFDNRKPQVIEHFALETGGPLPGAMSPTTSAGSGTTAVGSASAPAIVLPRRFMALFFDDIHTEFADLARTRDAADHYLASALRAGDRAGIFTSSGQHQLDFTDDRQKLHDALFSLRPWPMPSSAGECPTISDYQAYKIAEQQDPTALQIAETDALYQCCGGATPCPQADPNYLQILSRRILNDVEVSSRYVFQGLEALCRRMGTAVGQRSIVLASPGFFTDTETFELQEVIDRALRQNVVIGTLDARGLYVDIPGGDASQRSPGDPMMMGLKTQMHSESLLADEGVLASLANETGGVYFHNNNDLGEGFHRAGGFPEAYYVLTFVPDDLKLDGRMHTLKVTLAENSGHFTLQARKAYFAPKKSEDAATLAKEELEQMVFSQEEMHAIPIEVHTQFFTGPSGAQLSVVTHVDMSGVHFRKADGRNYDNLTLVTALFDQSGNYVTAQEKTVEFHMHDTTLARLNQTGLNMKSTLAVKPGTYLVREVVRESEGDGLSALNSQVEIP